MAERPDSGIHWPLLGLVGLNSLLLVLVAVVLTRAIQQGQAIDGLQRRLQAIEGGGGPRSQALLEEQLRQLGKRLDGLEERGLGGGSAGGSRRLEADLLPLPEPGPPAPVLPPPGLDPADPRPAAPSRWRWRGERPPGGGAPLQPPRNAPAGGAVLRPPGF